MVALDFPTSKWWTSLASVQEDDVREKIEEIRERVTSWIDRWVVEPLVGPFVKPALVPVRAKSGHNRRRDPRRRR